MLFEKKNRKPTMPLFFFFFYFYNYFICKTNHVLILFYFICYKKQNIFKNKSGHKLFGLGWVNLQKNESGHGLPIFNTGKKNGFKSG